MKLDIISGFLGAGKTTLMNKLLPHLNEKVVIIENEYGDIAVDGDLIDDELPVKEIMAGCICCSLVVDFQKAIKELSAKYNPDRIIIEPSGVSCLSDVLRACEKIKDEVEGGLEIERLMTVIDATSFEEYIENFGAFYANQIENANVIFLSHLKDFNKEQIADLIAKVKEVNPGAAIWQQDWFEQDGSIINDWLKSLALQRNYQPENDSKRVIFNAGDVFGSWSTTNDKEWTDEDIQNLFSALQQEENGKILRSKGILKMKNGKSIVYNYTPFNQEYHEITNNDSGKIVVIGCRLNEEKLAELF